MLWLYQKLQLLRTAICTKDSPRQMAAGIACGLLLGLLPKGNLLAAAVATALLSTRMSLATGMLCAFLASSIAPLLDPVTHRLGQSLLTHPTLVPLWRSLSRIPLAAWTAFNNTVVMGSLMVGLALLYPVYRTTLPWMERFQARYANHNPDNIDVSAAQSAVDRSATMRLVEPAQPVPTDGVSDQRRSCA